MGEIRTILAAGSRRGPGRLAALAAAAALALAGAFAAQADIGVRLQQKRSRELFDLGVGDAVRIQAIDSTEADVEPRAAIFLGSETQTGARTLYFLELASGRIVSAPLEETRIDPTPPAPAPRGLAAASAWLQRALHPKGECQAPFAGRRAGELAVQGIVELRTQGPAQCAAYSTFHCLEQLLDLRLLLDPALAEAMRSRPDGVLRGLLASGINAQNQVGLAELAWRFVLKRLVNPAIQVDKGIPSQTEARKQYFAAHGMRLEPTRDPERWKAHLRSGLPVLFDLPIARGEGFQVHPAELRRDRVNRVRTLADGRVVRREEASKYAHGMHAVLAVGWISEDRALILDSDPAGFYLLGADDLAHGVRERAGQALLVLPEEPGSS